MSLITDMERRRILTGIAASLPFLSGCLSLLGSEGENETPTETSTETSTESTTTEAQTTTVEQLGTTTATQTTQTTTPIATATQTTTPISTTTGTPLPTATGTTPRDSGTTNIDLTNLKTYTSQDPPYSIKYPSGWNKTESSTGKGVSFISYSGGFMTVLSFRTGPGTLDKFMTNFLRGYTRDADTSEISPRRNVSLPNGHTGKSVDVTTSSSTNSSQGTVSTTLHGKALFALVNGTIYLVLISVPQDAYTATIDKRMTTIIKSLTVG
jgi:hypothetical protein